MDRCAVLPPQAERLTCVNTSTNWHSQAPDKPTRAAWELSLGVWLVVKGFRPSPITTGTTTPDTAPAYHDVTA
jgi:hypothetical protein